MVFGRNLKKNSRAIDMLIESGPLNMEVEARAKMTTSCSDTAYIPKVADAGKLIKENGKDLQIMHNGAKVLAGGYYGDWMQKIIIELNGHHEPQEEKAFYEILKRIKRSSPVMIELGSFWAYYSLWFKMSTKTGVAVCCEPDPKNIKVGRENMGLNGFSEGKNLIFVDAAAGSEDKKMIQLELDSQRGTMVSVPIRSVDSIRKEHKLGLIDILHMDVQGVELDTLQGALTTIKEGKIRFLVVSTHHYVFSKDPMTHHKCEQFIKENGGHIITSHNVIESFSGDGLIVASFAEEDKDFHIDISINTGPALFRPYEIDIAVLLNAYDKL